jgi:diguanylate cyclase (GGDEF)-like protein
MNSKLKIAIAVTLGTASLLLGIYFYLLQKDFSHDYKEVSGQFHTLESSFGQINYEILQSALFAYHNQDTISSRLIKLRETYKMLTESSMLHQKQYARVLKAVEDAADDIDNYENGINRYMMINAGIKNSFVFLASLMSEDASSLSLDKELQDEIHGIVDQFSTARRMLDADYLADTEKILEKLGNSNLTGDQQEFINTFVLHAKFIIRNFPNYINSINSLLQAQTELNIRQIRELFIKTSQNDFQILDRLAYILLGVFIVAMVMIISLLIRSGIENMRLLRLQKELQHSLTHDQLTGLLNRVSYDTIIQQTKVPTLLLLNINNFKHINDFYGNETGDIILQEISSLIKLPLIEPYNPRFFRMGGDDFGILLNKSDLVHAERSARAIATTIESYPFIVDNIEIFITVSISVNNVDPFMENADMALKHLKTDYNDNVIVFTIDMRLKEKVQLNIATMQRIKSAIEENRIVPYYQPIFNLQTEEVEKYEALVRIEQRDDKVLKPSDFMDIAVQTPYYREISNSMLKQTIARFRSFNYRFSINLNMRDLLNSSFNKDFFKILDQNIETARRLDIELLENEELFNLDLVIDFIHRVSRYGCRVAVDDFGSGYSNFSYVSSLPIDILKIDGSLIRHIVDDKRKLNTVKTIIAFAQNLKLEIVAEYVEDRETAELLKSLGVTHAQGYYFGRPSKTIV